MRFVTSFLNLGEDRSKDKSIDKYIELFNRLASTGIPIHLFLSPSYKDKIPFHKNVDIDHIDLEDTDTYNSLKELSFDLPEIRTDYHDTKNFLILMNSKIEFLKKSMDKYKECDDFCWIDSGIFHVFRNTEESTKYLKLLSVSSLKTDSLCMPGCWPKGTSIDRITEHVNWRFCGGFLAGKRNRLEEFYDFYQRFFVSMVKLNKKLVWEVNVWAYLEFFHSLRFDWFKADHNDSIIRIPLSYLKVVASITSIPPRFNSSLKLSIDSLLHQVDTIYLSLARKYDRFPNHETTLPSYLTEEPYKSRVVVTYQESDNGPSMKYTGSLKSIPLNTWIFVGDDDQEYSHDLIKKMTTSIKHGCVVQNHYQPILLKSSGGLIHGYVGCLVNRNELNELNEWPLPPCAKFVDDQWMSVYCHKQKIPIIPSEVVEYKDIFKVLDGWHEKIGKESLSGLGNRDLKVTEISTFFNVKFLPRGEIMDI